VQYALIATENGIYPCYTCADAGFTIYLHIGEVWKYGMTRIGDKRRYPKGDYGADKVVFVEQFYGTYSECLKMEKIKLYREQRIKPVKLRIWCIQTCSVPW